jgi:hypothetical protein
MLVQSDSDTTLRPTSAARTAPSAKLALATDERDQICEGGSGFGEVSDVLRETARKIAALVSIEAAQQRDSDSDMARAFDKSKGCVGENRIRRVGLGGVIVAFSEVVVMHMFTSWRPGVSRGRCAPAP